METTQVGMLFFLFEFYGDQLLAFMLLALVWICELFSAITLRTRSTVRYFPRIFLLLFSCFHAYFFSFPSGFAYLALTTAVAFMHLAMLWFWNRREIPALRSGGVSRRRPRQVRLRVQSSTRTVGMPPSLAYFALLGDARLPAVDDGGRGGRGGDGEGDDGEDVDSDGCGYDGEDGGGDRGDYSEDRRREGAAGVPRRGEEDDAGADSEESPPVTPAFPERKAIAPAPAGLSTASVLARTTSGRRRKRQTLRSSPTLATTTLDGFVHIPGALATASVSTARRMAVSAGDASPE